MSDAARLVVVGPGRVGRSLAAGLDAAGEEVELRGRGTSPPDLPAGTPGVTGAAGLPDFSGSDARWPGTIVFAVPDDDLVPTVRSWVDALDAVGPAPVALHTSGVHGPDVLDPFREVGLAVASWHPLTSLAAPSGDAFRGVTFGVAGDDTAVERARGLADRLGGRIVRLEPGAHARYHAAAVFASNYVAACLAVAADELAAATAGRGGLDELAPLARAALENALERGVPDGLTGPVERGDVGTVRRHLEALPPERRPLYRQLARELLAVVQDRLPAGRSRELRELLDPVDS